MPENENNCPSCAEGAHPANKPLSNNPNVLVVPYTPPTSEEIEFTRQYYAARASRKTGANDRLLSESALPAQSTSRYSKSRQPGQALYEGMIVLNTNGLMIDPEGRAAISMLLAMQATSGAEITPTQTAIRRAMSGEDVLLASQLAAPWFQNARQTPNEPTREKPVPPSEPATEEDCDEWAKDYLEWLKDNGELVGEGPIVIPCDNKRYVFRRAPGGDEWDWIEDVYDVYRDVEDAVIEQLGDPMPSTSWTDPNDPEDFDEYWPVPSTKVDRDEDGEIVKKVLGHAQHCDELTIRIVDYMEWFLTRTFRFEKEYVVPDKTGQADGEAIDKYKANQQNLFLAQLEIAAKGPGPTEQGLPTPPTEAEVVASITTIFGPRLRAGRYFACEDPCHLKVKVVGLADVKFSVAPEAPFGSDRRERRVAASTRAASPSKVNGYWKVRITSQGSVMIRISADVTMDAYCER